MNLGSNKRSNSGAIVPIIIAGVAIIIGGFLIGALTPAIFPVQASAEAQQIDALFQVMLVIGGALFLLVQGALLYSVIRFRKRRGDDTDGPTIHGNVTLEIVWTAIPSVVVLLLVIYSYVVWVDIRTERINEQVIEAVGQRYVWAFTYTTPNPIYETGFDPEANPEDNPLKAEPELSFSDSVLHTYVNRPVRLLMETRDVNHAFWVPTMRIKQDLIAGRTTEITFTPTREGRYRVVCAELCGSGHGQMYSYIQVYRDEQQYMDAFLNRRVNNILNPPDDPVLIGRGLLEAGEYPCAGCHVLDDLGWQGITGPTLNGIADTAARRATAAGAPSAEFYIAQSIRHPNAYIVPGYAAGVMPQFGPVPADEFTGPIEGAGYNYMRDESLIAITSYLCTQTSGDESPCGDVESVIEAVAAQR